MTLIEVGKHPLELLSTFLALFSCNLFLLLYHRQLFGKCISFPCNYICRTYHFILMKMFLNCSQIAVGQADFVFLQFH